MMQRVQRNSRWRSVAKWTHAVGRVQGCVPVVHRCVLALVPVSAVIMLVGVAPVAGQGKPADSRAEDQAATLWRPLFDTQALVEQPGGPHSAAFHVEQGVIVGENKDGKSPGLRMTAQRFGDFLLELEYKVDSRMDAGVRIRCYYGQTEAPVILGLELPLNPDRQPWACMAYGRHMLGGIAALAQDAPARRAFRRDDWNRLRVEARGASIRTWINGVPAADLFLTNWGPIGMTTGPAVGMIALHVGHGEGPGPHRVYWRNVRIQDLGRSVWRSLFDGRTLAGWNAHGAGHWVTEGDSVTLVDVKGRERISYFVTDEEYRDFTLRMQFLAAQGNVGVAFRAALVGGSVLIPGLEVVLDPGGQVGGIYDYLRGVPIAEGPQDVGEYYQPGQWARLELSVRDQRAVVRINGRVAVDVRVPAPRPTGHIALQWHRGIEPNALFKDIEILVNEPSKPEAKQEAAPVHTPTPRTGETSPSKPPATKSASPKREPTHAPADRPHRSAGDRPAPDETPGLQPDEQAPKPGGLHAAASRQPAVGDRVAVAITEGSEGPVTMGVGSEGRKAR